MDEKEDKLQVTYVPIDEVIPYDKNPKTHSKEQINEIAASISKITYSSPILVDENKVIIAGHGRLMALKQLGWKEVPIIILHGLTEDKKKALLIADNKIAENSGWNEELLAELLKELHDHKFDLTVTGFSNKELEKFETEFFNNEEQIELENTVPDIEENKVIAKRGDVWILGEHKLLCGDACNPKDLETLMGDEIANMVFTDPPYNVNYGNSLRDKLAGEEGKRSILNDNLGDGFCAFLYDALKNMIKYTRGSLYICMGGSELHTLHDAFVAAEGKIESYIVWVKDKFTLSRSKYQHRHEWIMQGVSNYENRHEEILFGNKKGSSAPWYGGRNQDDVWEFSRPAKSELHPTMKPIALVERAINNSSKTLDIVLDVFGGSGSTLIACENTNRRCRMIELDEKYIDVIIKRWQDYTGKKAKLQKTQQTFDEVAKERTS